MNVKLPRPLKSGEFFCHECGKFFPLTESEQHKKEHARQQK